ncbi:MAG: hypothetical protein CK423_09460, partial [Legionella sp.]
HTDIRLETLDLSYNFKLNDECCDALSKIYVQKIDMSGTQITSTGTHNILQNSRLLHLVLRQNPTIKDLNGIYFYKNTQLVSLDLASCELSDKDVLAILDCKSLRFLCLDNNCSSQTKEVLRALGQSDITHLSLAFNELIDGDTLALRNCRQTRLDMTNNCLSMKGAALLLESNYIKKLILKPGNPELSQENIKCIKMLCDDNLFISNSGSTNSWYSWWKCPELDSTRSNTYQMINTK